MAVKVFLTLFSILILSLHTFAQANGRSDHFTFRQGVTLNHWTRMPIEGWTFADPKWFGEKDVKWIADTGIDHLKLYVSAKDVFKADDSPDLEKLAAVDSAIGWTQRAGLGIVLTLTPSQMPDSADKQSEFWGKFANHFRSRGVNVRFLIGNPVRGDNDARNDFYRLATAVTRSSSVYDYNSGSPIRYSNGEKALMLKVLGLKPKRR